MNNTRLTLFLLAATLWLITSCAVNPVTGKREFVLMSESQEIEIGKQMDPKITKEYGGLYPEESLQQYVNEIGQKLAIVCDRPDLIYRFRVINSPIVNAFALPGGYVYVTRGLLAYINNEAELAGVLGHEIGHITARHAVRQYTKAQTYQAGIFAASILYPEIGQLGQFADFIAVAILQGYSRSYELQADRLGITYTSTAGYDPHGVPSFMQTLYAIEKATGQKGYHGLFSSHPETEERIMKAKSEVQKVMTATGSTYQQRRERYLSMIEGLLFGDDPKEGIIVKNVFKHPELRIELTFPEGWTINNGKEVLAATDPQRQYFIQMTLIYLTKKISASDFAREVARLYHFHELSGSPQHINTLPAYVGIYKGAQENMGEIRAIMASVLVDDNGYAVIGFSSPDSFPQARPLFTSSIYSFKRLSPEEAKKIKPHRIRIYTVKKGDSWEGIARRCGQQSSEAKTLALINGFDPVTPPPPATKIKAICVEEQS